MAMAEAWAHHTPAGSTRGGVKTAVPCPSWPGNGRVTRRRRTIGVRPAWGTSLIDESRRAASFEAAGRSTGTHRNAPARAIPGGPFPPMDAVEEATAGIPSDHESLHRLSLLPLILGLGWPIVEVESTLTVRAR
jgi:hypothetical protein